MCVVSAVTDHYQREWGQPWQYPAPIFPGMTPSQRIISEQQWQEYQRLKRAAEEIDQKTNQPDCIKPDLAEWEASMEAFLVKKGVLSGT